MRLLQMNHLARAASAMTGSHQARGTAQGSSKEHVSTARGSVALQAAKSSGAAKLLKRFLHLT